jgi:hypothetical protein
MAALGVDPGKGAHTAETARSKSERAAAA